MSFLFPTKLEPFVAFLFRENWRPGWTDGCNT